MKNRTTEILPDNKTSFQQAGKNLFYWLILSDVADDFIVEWFVRQVKNKTGLLRRRTRVAAAQLVLQYFFECETGYESMPFKPYEKAESYFRNIGIVIVIADPKFIFVNKEKVLGGDRCAWRGYNSAEQIE